VKLSHPDLRVRLAAEYALGTLHGAARRRFRDYLARDAALAAEVQRWEAWLTPWAGVLEPVEPPARVWARIDSRIQRPASVNRAEPALLDALRRAVSLWRAVAIGAGSLAAAILVAWFGLRGPQAEPTLTSILAGDDEVARVFIAQPASNLLQVQMIKPWKALNGMALELWVIPAQGAPRSLGVINGDADTRIALAGLDSKLADGTAFALSKEPAGGSPTGAPTGKVLCKGVIARVPPRARPSA
jgi:anti-sigma-K factor RskA